MKKELAAFLRRVAARLDPLYVASYPIIHPTVTSTALAAYEIRGPAGSNP